MADEEDRKKGAQCIQFAVGEIDDPPYAEHEGQAYGHEDIAEAVHEAVDYGLEEELHAFIR